MTRVADAIPELSVVIPAYNAAARLGVTLRDTGGWLSGQGIDHEVIVVDDASTDATREGCGPGVRVLSHPRNRGKGAAVRTGMAAASRAWRLFMDADNSTTIDHLERFAGAVAGFRAGAPLVVIGSRRAPGARVIEPRATVRRALGRAFPRLVRAVALPEVADSQCGFKLFSAAAAEAIFPRCCVERFAFDVEVLLLARRLGIPVIEVPITWNNPRESTLRVGGDSVRMLIDVLACAARLGPDAPIPPVRGGGKGRAG